MHALSIVILAAGKGTRMFSTLPKVLHKLAGQPLISHVIAAASELNPAQTVVVYGHGGNAVCDTIGKQDILWVEQSHQLGTGHAVQQALPRLSPDGTTLILYGDVPLIRPSTLSGLVRGALSGKLALLTTTLEDPHGYGRILRDVKGAVTGIVEHKDANEAQLQLREVNTGILAAPTNLLHRWLARLTNDNRQKEYYLTDIVAMAVADGVEVSTSEPSFEWEILGVNSKSQLAELERLYQSNYASKLMQEGVSLADPARIDVRGHLICGRDVSVDVNCVFEGRVNLGDRVSIGPNCVLRDVTVAAGSEILPFCHIESAEIGENCRVGPYARVRPGTRVQDDVHLGNFVEIKNSTVDKGSKINHLSYVGDSVVGKNVNVGAGTITCNYDGANKHRTIIEDDVFIGSDTQLVAPVVIGKGATIGAGSTVTKDAPGGELTLSRSSQLTVSGWKRPQKKSS